MKTGKATLVGARLLLASIEAGAGGELGENLPGIAQEPGYDDRLGLVDFRF